MKIDSRTDAQRRADDIQVFRRELTRLESERALELTVDQRSALAHHHDRLLAEYSQSFDIDRDAQAKQLSLGMRIASFLGALAFAASVFFLFRQYWGLFPTGIQITLLIVAAFASLLATHLIARRDGSGYFAKLAAMVAFACFVLNIFLIGKIFNVTPSDKALLPWAALAFLFAYALDLKLLLAAGILCVIAFISARTGTLSGLYWIDFGMRPENFFPAALLLFCVPAIFGHERFAGFDAVYRVFGMITFFLPVLVLSNWGGGSYLRLAANIIEGSYQVLGFAVSALAVWYGARHDYRHVVNTGVTFFVIFLYSKFYDWWWEAMPKSVFFLIIGLTSLLFILIMKRLRTGEHAQQGAAQ